MRRRFRVLSYALVATLGLAVWLPAQTVTIHGYVLRDDTGSPVAGADVRVARVGSQFLEAHLETDRDGKFQAEGLAAGQYELCIGRPGYLDTVVVPEKLGAPLWLRLIRGGVISGRITWPDGEPMGAIAYLRERTPNGSMGRTVYSVASRSDGQYRIQGIGPGAYYLEIQPPGTNMHGGGTLYPSNQSPHLFEIAGGEEFPGRDLTLSLEDRVQVSGSIEIAGESTRTFDAPQHVPGAQPQRPPAYSVAIGPREQPGLVIARTHSDKDGRFQFPSIAPGRYVLYGSGPSGSTSMHGNAMEREQRLFFGKSPVDVVGTTKDLSLQLSPSREATLVLKPSRFGSDGCPASLLVRLRMMENWGVASEHLVTLPFGEETVVKGLAPTRYELTHVPNDSGCGIVGAPVLDLTGDIPKAPSAIHAAGATGSVAGAVVAYDSSKPLEAMLAPIGEIVSTEIGNNRLRVAPVNHNGMFRFNHLPPGTYGLALRMAMGGNGGLPPPRSRFTEVEVQGGVVEIQMYPPLEAAR